jgi:hypothetical protein
VRFVLLAFDIFDMFSICGPPVLILNVSIGINF